MTVRQARYILVAMDISEQIAACQKEGMSIPTIAIILGVEECEVEELVTPSTPSIFANKGIPIEKILTLARRGFKVPEIAKLLGCGTKNIYDRLEPYKDDLKTLDDYKEHKADIFNLKQRELLSALTPAKIKEMSALQMVTSVGILNDKIRAETGKDVKVALNLSKVIHEIHQLPGGANLPTTIDIEALEAIEDEPPADDKVRNGQDGGGGTGG